VNRAWIVRAETVPHTVVVDVPYQRDDGLDEPERTDPREMAATEARR
jgi:hypothetical protein